MVDTTSGDSLRPATKAALVVTNVAFADGACIALCVGTPGTGTVTFADDSVATNYPLQAGYNPIQVKKVVLGTAANVWALYN